LKRHSQFEYRNKIYQGKKKLPCPALPCPALCPGCPQGNQGRAKIKFCPAGQGRASGRADSPALMTVSGVHINIQLVWRSVEFPSSPHLSKSYIYIFKTSVIHDEKIIQCKKTLLSNSFF